MKAWGLITLLLLPWTGFSQQQYYGTPVASLTLSGVPDQADLNLLPLKPGDIITTENVRTAIQILYNTGRYSYIEVDAGPADGGTVLTFKVRLHYFFSTLRLEPENLLDRSLTSFFRWPVGPKFSQPEVDRIVTGTVDLLVGEGYFNARVTPILDFNDQTRLVSVTLRAEVNERARVGKVVVEGGEQTFPLDELQDSLDIESGQDFSAADLEKGIAAVRKKFTDLDFLNTSITVDRTYNPTSNTVDLTVSVQPGVFVLVQTRGYDDISRSRLRELVPVFEEGTVDPDLVEEGRIEIAKYMERSGFFEATAKSEVFEAPLDNAIQIVYEIVPGEQHRIRDIVIDGNDFFSDDELRRGMQVRRAGFFSRGVFSAELMEDDVQTILTMYRNAGFLDAEVRNYFEESSHEVTVVIRVLEGKQYSIEKLTFVGNTAVTEEELRLASKLEIGQTYTPVAVEEARRALTTVYYERGYPDVRVEPSSSRVQTNHGFQVDFQITEGQHFNIGNIVVAGNTITRDKIIHRNARLSSRSPYNPEAILSGQQSLYATGLFTRAEIVPLEQELPGMRNLLIQVEDAKPKLVTYGFGIQEWEGPRGTVEFTHSNLFGLDRTISFRVRGSKKEQHFQSTFTEPWLFNHDIDSAASLLFERAQQRAFAADRIQFSFQTLKRFSSELNLLGTANYDTVNLRDIRVNQRFLEFPEETGVIQIAQIGTSLIFDRRDDPFNPNNGSFQQTTFQVASKLLASEINFTSIFNQSSFYMPVGSSVFAGSARFGWNQPYGSTQRLPITNRYFAGGSTTLRGFDQDEAGVVGGGNVLTIGNLEYRVPLRNPWLDRLVGVVFYDTGTTFRRISEVSLSEFTHSAGFGFRYGTPLGPVRVDIGFNLDPKIRPDGQKEERVQVFFTLGQVF